MELNYNQNHKCEALGWKSEAIAKVIHLGLSRTADVLSLKTIQRMMRYVLSGKKVVDPLVDRPAKYPFS